MHPIYSVFLQAIKMFRMVHCHIALAPYKSLPLGGRWHAESVTEGVRIVSRVFTALLKPTSGKPMK